MVHHLNIWLNVNRLTERIPVYLKFCIAVEISGESHMLLFIRLKRSITFCAAGEWLVCVSGVHLLLEC